METLTKHFREITRAAFARHGFAQGEVISHWAEIVGPDLAGVSAPERIKWPRGSGEDKQKSGGTLVIRAAPGRGLDLQYEAPRIIGRVNGFFGYQAVAQIKVMASAGFLPGPPKTTFAEVKPISDQNLEKLDDGPLKAALERLARGIAGARASSPQGK
jgi:hypothetical protein